MREKAWLTVTFPSAKLLFLLLAFRYWVMVVAYFYAAKNQHVKETKCIAMGDTYCEWEFG